jgi:hypothetical protein
LPGTIDDFATCDVNIYTAEGRKGTWYGYIGAGVSCLNPPCGGVGIPPWGTTCGAWTSGGLYDTLDAYAGLGMGPNGPGVTYDACGYNAVEVSYATDQAIRMYAKCNGTGTSAPRAYVTLPATTGTTTTTVSLSTDRPMPSRIRLMARPWRSPTPPQASWSCSIPRPASYSGR